MANRKVRSRRGRRTRPNKAVHSQIARVFTGIPRTSTSSTDPPLIPTFIDYCIRTRFVIRYTPETTSSSRFGVLRPGSAWQTGGLNVYKADVSNATYNLYLDKEDVYDAATMRAFGLAFADASPGSVNQTLKDETEFSIQSVTLWGAANPAFEKTITLMVDLSDGTPGATVTDAGDRLRRPCAKVTASRLNWEKYGTKSLTEGFCVARLSAPYLETATTDFGTLDVVVRMRRSFNAIVNSTSRSADLFDESM